LRYFPFSCLITLVLFGNEELSDLCGSCRNVGFLWRFKEYYSEADKIEYTVEQFADLQILRYDVPGFEKLSLKQKELVYYLTQAALQGRDILFDQNGKYNLTIRKTLEAIYVNYKGDKSDKNFKNMEVYLKRVWFSNGIHHHYGSEKFSPEFSEDFLKKEMLSLEPTNCL
jgi:dipeptidyl-peptidase-3